jgi:hypothetical protein
MGARGVIVAVAVIVSVARARVAAADSALITKAQTAVDASDYDTAKAALAEALTSGANGPEDLAQIYRLSGIVYGSLGDAKIATDAFERLLALSPKATLPAGTSPKIGKPFKAAQDFYKKHEPLRARVETSERPATATLVVASDPLAMIARARVTFRADGKPDERIEASGKDRIVIDLPRAHRLDLRVAAIDQHGNRVVELGSTDVPIVIVVSDVPIDVTPQPPTPPRKIAGPPPKPRKWYARWRVWGTATVVAAAGAAGFGIATIVDIAQLNHLNANSVDHDFTEARKVESRARADFIVTQVFAGTAGALAIGTAILYLTSPRIAERAPSLGAMPVRGGGGIVMGGHF